MQDKNLIFGDDELVYSKAYIESVKSRITEIALYLAQIFYSARAFTSLLISRNTSLLSKK